MPRLWLKPARRWPVQVRERAAEWLRTLRRPQPGLLGASIWQRARWANTGVSAAKVASAANNSESGAAAFLRPPCFWAAAQRWGLPHGLRSGGVVVRAAKRRGGRALVQTAVGPPCGRPDFRSFSAPFIFLKGNSFDRRGFCDGNHSQPPPHHLGFLWGRRNERVTAL